MKTSRLRQVLFDLAMAVPRRTAIGSLAFDFLLRASRLGPGGRRALVEYDLDGEILLIPVGHELARYRRYCAGYGATLMHVARAVHAKYPDMSAIDIGANVGDSTLLVRRGARVPVLCIEGDDWFVSILRHNLREASEVEVAQAFVGPADGENRVRADRAGGTLRLVADARSGQPVRFSTLRSVLATRSRFARARLLKIDTDGFDCHIVAAERQMLADVRPVVFFEYDPDLYDDPAAAFAVFPSLAAAGYGGVIAYLNHGEYLVAAELSDRVLLEDLHGYVTGGDRYLDLAAFHRDDEDLRQRVRQVELGPAWE